jgi:cold shock CspA family protein
VILRGSGGEISMHRSAMLAGGLQTLLDGQRMQLTAVRDLKGLQAGSVQEL